MIGKKLGLNKTGRRSQMGFDSSNPLMENINITRVG